MFSAVMRSVERLKASRTELHSTEQAASLLGLFADEPDLVAEVLDMAMEARKKDALRTNGRDYESNS